MEKEVSKLNEHTKTHLQGEKLFNYQESYYMQCLNLQDLIITGILGLLVGAFGLRLWPIILSCLRKQQPERLQEALQTLHLQMEANGLVVPQYPQAMEAQKGEVGIAQGNRAISPEQVYLAASKLQGLLSK